MLVLRLLPLLSLLGFLAGPGGWLEDHSLRPAEGRIFTVAANGMAIDPDGRTGPGGAPVTIADPTDPGL